MEGEGQDGFAAFFRRAEPRLRRAFAAAYGLERGAEALAEAWAYAWEHWESVRMMDNPAGYLYRVGQSRTRPRLRPRAARFPAPTDEAWVEPALPGALASLTPRQRLPVVLVEGFQWTLTEVSELTGTSVSTVRRHYERGMADLRRKLEVRTDA